MDFKIASSGTLTTLFTFNGLNNDGGAFDGRAAVFTVVSSSEITTTVPSGATTGEVKVATPGGTLSSNAPFDVAP